MVRKMAEAEGITEDLKATDQMAWVGRMNSIRQQAEETICNELIYARSLPPFSLCFLLFCQQQGHTFFAAQVDVCIAVQPGLYRFAFHAPGIDGFRRPFFVFRRPADRAPALHPGEAAQLPGVLPNARR